MGICIWKIALLPVKPWTLVTYFEPKLEAINDSGNLYLIWVIDQKLTKTQWFNWCRHPILIDLGTYKEDLEDIELTNKAESLPWI